MSLHSLPHLFAAAVLATVVACARSAQPALPGHPLGESTASAGSDPSRPAPIAPGPRNISVPISPAFARRSLAPRAPPEPAEPTTPATLEPGNPDEVILEPVVPEPYPAP